MELVSFHTQSDFANNEKFITLNIAPSDGNRLYLPDNFVVQGVKINTPHYLAKLEELPPGDSTFTIIVSQLDSLSTIHYTLRVCVCGGGGGGYVCMSVSYCFHFQVYATCEFVLAPVPNPYHHTEEVL